MSHELTARLAAITPNIRCAVACPIIELDAQAVVNGVTRAVDDYERHAVESLFCQGTVREQRAAGIVRKCPLFGLESEV